MTNGRRAQPLTTGREIYSPSILRGALTSKDRYKINAHMTSIAMLERKGHIGAIGIQRYLGPVSVSQ